MLTAEQRGFGEFRLSKSRARPHAVADTPRGEAAQFVGAGRVEGPQGFPTAIPSLE